ncbi:hypothetical protein BHM03_00025348, partial [Ensete ventricosum]
PNLWLDRGPTTSAGPNGQPRNFDINLNLNGHSTTKSLPTFSLAETTLPHIINALEVYSAGSSRRRPPVAPTLMPLTWSGDPCSPGGHIWDGLDCSYSVSDPPGITSVSVSKRQNFPTLHAYLTSSWTRVLQKLVF